MVKTDLWAALRRPEGEWQVWHQEATLDDPALGPILYSQTKLLISWFLMWTMAGITHSYRESTFPWSASWRLVLWRKTAISTWENRHWVVEAVVFVQSHHLYTTHQSSREGLKKVSKHFNPSYNRVDQINPFKSIVTQKKELLTLIS